MVFRNAAFCAALLCVVGSQPAWSEGPSLLSNQLKDVRTISIDVYVKPTPECPMVTSAIRDVIVNKIIPAGLQISDNYYKELRVEILTITNKNPNIIFGCSSHVLFDYVAVMKVIPDTGGEALRFVSLWSSSVITTSNQNSHTASVRGVMDEALNSFLAKWREANAGADFVRQSPPLALPTTPNLRTVQQRLQSLGHYRGPVDGITGPGTTQAIQSFQRGQQLPATGDLDLDTMRKLFP